MVGVFGGARAVWLGLAAVALVAPEGLEEADRDQAAGVRQRGVACLVPVLVVLATDDVKEVAAREAQLLGILRGIVVEGTNNLSGTRSVSVWVGRAEPEDRPA